MSRQALCVVLWLLSVAAVGQPISGSSGLLNIPSAEMRQDGTISAGANFLPDKMTPSQFNYDTGNYYFNITFLPFFEFTYRMTLLKVKAGNFNQDRSFGMRFRVVKEQAWLPSVVIGGNDLYSSSGENAEYFNALYGVMTKHISAGRGEIGLTAGYGHQGFGGEKKENLKGLFGGLSFSPGFAPSIRVMGEYDSNVFNAGASVLLFRHLFLFGMLHDMKVPTGGVGVFIYL